MRARTLSSLAIGILVVGVSLESQAPPSSQGAPTPGPPQRAQAPPRDSTAPVPTGTARIRGRVVAADTGAPLRRAQVRITTTELRMNRSANTDAEGRYEFADLPAARYTITVSRNGYVSLQFGQQRPFESGRPLEVAAGQIVERIDFALPRGGVIAGRVTDELGEPMAGVRVMAMRYQYLPTGQRRLSPVYTGGPLNSSNDLGEFRIFGLMPGAYILSAAPTEIGGMFSGGAPSTSATPESDGLGVTYYPGTINAEEAQPVTVGIAEEAHASFALVPTRMTRISGVVRNSQGKPLSGALLVIRTQSGNGMFSRALPGIGPDGRFTISDIPPGDHWLDVLPRSGDEEFATVAVTAGGRDITDLVITTGPGVTISGQVTFEGTSTDQKPGRITATAAEPGGPLPVRSLGDSGVIDATGRFQIRGAFGRVLFRPAPIGFGPLIGWSIKSVKLKGEDIADMPLDVATVGDATLEVVLTDQQTTLSGTVKTAQGEQVKDYSVAIFPDRLREGAVPTRFIRVARPDQQGRFEAKGLPAGEYLAAAVETLEQGEQWDPAFRKRIAPVAKRFRLDEGKSVSVDLELMR